MANKNRTRIPRLLLAAGAASLLLANVSASQLTQQATNQLGTESESFLESQSLMKLASVQHVVNQALTNIVAKTKSKSTIGVHELQTETKNLKLSDKELNDQLYIQLQSYVNTNADAVEGILSFDCVVGQTGCIYTDKTNLASGKMEVAARNKLISTMLPTKSNKPQIQSKVSSPKMSSHLAQTGQQEKQANVQSKDFHPPSKQNLQQKSQLKRDNSIERKQRQIMKGINNPIDEIERNLAKVVKNKASDEDMQHDYAKDLMQSSAKKFNSIFNSMNNFKLEEKHIDLHEEKARLTAGQQPHEVQRRSVFESVRKQQHPQGNQGVTNLQQEADINLQEDSRPIDKTAIMTSVEKHHHHTKPKDKANVQKAQEKVSVQTAEQKGAKKTTEVKAKAVIETKQQACPTCKECPACQCAAQSVSPLEELATHSNELSFQSADDKPEEIRLNILPQDLRDYITKDVQVLNSERILGYNTYNNILEQERGITKDTQLDSNSDFYNVTVNFVMKRKASYKANSGPKEIPIQVYENSLMEVERHQNKVAQEKAESLAEEENEPHVIMPSELKIPSVPKPAEKSVHELLQESRVSKEEEEELVDSAELVQQTEEQRLNQVQKQLQSIPIELNNAQIAAQIQNLTPEEANQLFIEADKVKAVKPPSAVNLMISEEPSKNISQQSAQINKDTGIDPKEMQRLNNFTVEGNDIEGSFTEFIVPNNHAEADLLNSVTEQQMATNFNRSNETALIKHQARQEQHFNFLNRLKIKAEQDLQDEQNGIRKPITTNKLTQQMYSHARGEFIHQDPINATANSTALSQHSDDDTDALEAEAAARGSFGMQDSASDDLEEAEVNEAETEAENEKLLKSQETETENELREIQEARSVVQRRSHKRAKQVREEGDDELEVERDPESSKYHMANIQKRAKEAVEDKSKEENMKTKEDSKQESKEDDKQVSKGDKKKGKHEKTANSAKEVESKEESKDVNKKARKEESKEESKKESKDEQKKDNKKDKEESKDESKDDSPKSGKHQSKKSTDESEEDEIKKLGQDEEVEKKGKKGSEPKKAKKDKEEKQEKDEKDKKVNEKDKAKKSKETVDIQSRLEKKVAKLKAKLEKLKKDADQFRKRREARKNAKRVKKTPKEKFDEIQFMNDKKKAKKTQADIKYNHDIRFDEDFLKRKLFLDYDLPLEQVPKKTSIQKLKEKKFNEEKLKNPFGIQSLTPGKKVDRIELQKKFTQETKMLRVKNKHAAKEIGEIFKGKRDMTEKQIKELEDPKNIHALFAPPEDDAKQTKSDVSKALDKKKQLDPHKLFQGKTSEQKALRKLISGKHHIAQTATSGQIFDDDQDSDKIQDDDSQFSTNEILKMEELTLLKKIDIDLKVLAKIEHEKYPADPAYEFKLVKVETEDEKLGQDEDEIQPAASLVQKSPASIKRSADEFVQASAQNILEMKDFEPANKNQTQALTQTQTHQRVIQDMSELQRKFEETTKAKEEIVSKEEQTKAIRSKLQAKAEEEKVKRKMLMQKAQAMAQADLVAKHALRKATEQAAIDKEQKILSIQKEVEEGQQRLAEQKKMLEEHKKEAQKAKALVEKAQKEEQEMEGRLEQEEHIRFELEKKEQEKSLRALKQQEEIQKLHEQKMQKLIHQQLELQNRKKQILLQQENERKRLEQELERVNKVKAELLKVSGPDHGDSSDSQMSISDNLNLLSNQEIVIQEAIDKVKQAEKLGEKKGLVEAEKMMKKVETQSLEQSEADMKQLQSKFKNTSKKVKDIIDNFQKVHSDLQTLKNQYVQQLEFSGNSTNSTQSGMQTSSDEELVLSNKLIQLEQSNLALKMKSHHRQMKQIVKSLSQIKQQVPNDLAVQIEQTRDMGIQDLVMIENELNLPH